MGRPLLPCLILLVLGLCEAKTYMAELYLTGFGQAEGPSVDAQGNLFVCTGNLKTIKRVAPQGTVNNFATLVGPNGSDFDPLGNLFVADAAGKKVVKISKQGTITTVAEHTPSGGILRVPNDVTVAADGTLYFTDSDAGLVYSISNTGEMRLFASAPGANGLTLSLFQDKLVVGTGTNNVTTLYEWSISPGGGTNQRLVSTNAKWSDGMETDTQGNYWFCLYDKGKAFRITPSGQYLDTITLPAGCTDLTNIAFGGTDNRTAYLTESRMQAIYKTVVDVPGVPKGERVSLFPSIRIAETNPVHEAKSAFRLAFFPGRIGSKAEVFDLCGRRLPARMRSFPAWFPVVLQPR